MGQDLTNRNRMILGLGSTPEELINSMSSR